MTNSFDKIRQLVDIDAPIKREETSSLGNAVRFSTMMSMIEEKQSRGEVYHSARELANNLDVTLEARSEEFAEAYDRGRYDRERRELAYETELGRTISRETAFNNARAFAAQQKVGYNTSSTAKSFFGSFTRGDNDFFGTETLYDNVFARADEYTKPLSQKQSSIEDYGVAASSKIVTDISRSSYLSSEDHIDRLDTEFTRFHGRSIVDKASMTGSGLRAARKILRNTTHIGTVSQVQSLRQQYPHLSEAELKAIINTSEIEDNLRQSIETIDELYRVDNREEDSSRIITKAGVKEFVKLFNSAENNITIQTYQFQNDTISASLKDVIKRRVLKIALDQNGATPTPFEVNFITALPRDRKRSVGGKKGARQKGAEDKTSYSILGPNLIEAIKLKELEEEIKSYLTEELSVEPDDIGKYFKLNVQFRDRKFHPKLYMTDKMAAIGTQNLTSPVGNSINQAGSNFEQMYIVHNRYGNDTDRLLQDKKNYSNTKESSEKIISNSDIRASLIYRQIKQASDLEMRVSADDNEGYGLMKTRGQVGLNADIFSHLKDTINYSAEYYERVTNASTKTAGFETKVGEGNVSMLFILDQSFLLQYGSIFSQGQKTTEEKDEFRKLQSKLFKLITLGQAKVAVDNKNYQRSIIDPIKNKINSNEELKKVYKTYGGNIGLMSGTSLFGPKKLEDYDSSMTKMKDFLIKQGFTESRGFSTSDLEQIIAMGSGNIEATIVPRQHTKSFAMYEREEGASKDSLGELKSYYLGSSNLGVYSLGIPKVDGTTDFSLVNTEVGLLLGRSNVSKDYNIQPNFNETSEDYSLTAEMERDELSQIRERFIHTYRQVTNNSIEGNTDTIYPIKNTPMWQENINSSNLTVLKNRLLKLQEDLGVERRGAFNVFERKDHTGRTVSLNVSINTKHIFGKSDYINPETRTGTMNYEITVLKGVNEESSSGYVYFVDKNKLIGNGLFVNNSSESIEVYGRNSYEDRFDKENGRIVVKKNQKAHMNSLDLVPQIFGSILAEGLQRAAINHPSNIWENASYEDQSKMIEEYISKSMFGIGSHISTEERRTVIEDAEDNYFVSRTAPNIDAFDNLINNASFYSYQEFLGKVRYQIFNDKSSAVSIASFKDGEMDTNKKKKLLVAYKNFAAAVSSYRNTNTREERKLTTNLIIDSYRQLLHTMPSLTTELVQLGTYTNKEDYLTAYKEFVASQFDSFLQAKDERTYGGQQGAYRTTLLGLTEGETASAQIMAEGSIDSKPSINNVFGYARFQSLSYNPTTELHDYLYRSVASKSTAMSTNNEDLDSESLGRESMKFGDAYNLRILESVGIGTVVTSNSLLQVSNKDEVILSDVLSKFISSTSSVLEKEENIKEFTKAVIDSFKGIDVEEGSIQNKEVFSFYTGGKLSQLPQRIKNAIGARPMYQYSIEAQRILNEQDLSKTLSSLSADYINKYKTKLDKARKQAVNSLGNIKNYSNTDVETAQKYIVDSEKRFNSHSYGLGVIFKGSINTILSQDQYKEVETIREEISELYENYLEEEDINELVRVEVLRKSLSNTQMGKAIGGNDRSNYNMVLLQLNGVYTDTFLANPLYGSVYKDKETYQRVRRDKNRRQKEIEKGGVIVDSLKEGFFETQQKSIKSSMIGEGGFEEIVKKGDKVVELKKDDGSSTGTYVVKRFDTETNTWDFVRNEDNTLLKLDKKRNVVALSNVIDNSAYSPVDSPSVASSLITNYGRVGEDSVDYVFNLDYREGAFGTNEYLQFIERLRAVTPKGGRRVEGTDNSALVKGVSNFAGDVVTKEGKVINYFQSIENQIESRLQNNEVGGSLAYVAKNIDNLQSEKNEGYVPLSSVIHGLYNNNNFKSFFWTHGAKLLTSTREVNGKAEYFLIDNLLQTENTKDSKVSKAKNIIAALITHFGDDFFVEGASSSTMRSIQKSYVTSMEEGEFGKTYQALAVSQRLLSAWDVKDVDSENAYDKSTSIVYKSLKQKKGKYDPLNLAGLSTISASTVQQVLEGEEKAAVSFLKQITNMIEASKELVGSKGYLTLGGAEGVVNRNNAAILTAIDLFEQVVAQNKAYEIPSEVDTSEENFRQILYGITGLRNDASEEDKEDVLAMIRAISTNVNLVSVFADISFSISKDPTGTQTVGKHEAQHLITPFLGDINKYQEGGDLSKIQHTLSSLLALSTGAYTGSVYLEGLNAEVMGRGKAISLGEVGDVQSYLLSSFVKGDFLGFYQSSDLEPHTTKFIGEYKSLNKALATSIYYDRERNTFTAEGLKAVRDYVVEDLQIKNQEKIEKKIAELTSFDDVFFATKRFSYLEERLQTINDIYQADPNKPIGQETTRKFVENMKNDTLFFSIPILEFKQQNSVVTSQISDEQAYTFLPSAELMRNLGSQHQDFIDPLLEAYKTLSSLFTPGHIAHKAFQKVMAASKTDTSVVLTDAEAKALTKVTQAALSMPVEVEKALGSQRMQEAAAGKNKYTGFTSTGIGSLLMPLNSVALAQAKLEQAGVTSQDSPRLLAIDYYNTLSKKEAKFEKFQVEESDKPISALQSSYLDEIKSISSLIDTYKSKLKPSDLKALYNIKRKLEDSLYIESYALDSELQIKNLIGLSDAISDITSSGKLDSSIENQLKNTFNKLEVIIDVQFGLQAYNTQHQIINPKHNRLIETQGPSLETEFSDFITTTLSEQKRKNSAKALYESERLIVLNRHNFEDNEIINVHNTIVTGYKDSKTGEIYRREGVIATSAKDRKATTRIGGLRTLKEFNNVNKIGEKQYVTYERIVSTNSGSILHQTADRSLEVGSNLHSEKKKIQWQNIGIYKGIDSEGNYTNLTIFDSSSNLTTNLKYLEKEIRKTYPNATDAEIRREVKRVRYSNKTIRQYKTATLALPIYASTVEGQEKLYEDSIIKTSDNSRYAVIIPTTSPKVRYMKDEGVYFSSKDSKEISTFSFNSKEDLVEFLRTKGVEQTQNKKASKYALHFLSIATKYDNEDVALKTIDVEKSKTSVNTYSFADPRKALDFLKENAIGSIELTKQRRRADGTFGEVKGKQYLITINKDSTIAKKSVEEYLLGNERVDKQTKKKLKKRSTRSYLFDTQEQAIEFLINKSSRRTTDGRIHITSKVYDAKNLLFNTSSDEELLRGTTERETSTKTKLYNSLEDITYESVKENVEVKNVKSKEVYSISLNPKSMNSVYIRDNVSGSDYTVYDKYESTTYKFFGTEEEARTYVDSNREKVDRALSIRRHKARIAYTREQKKLNNSQSTNTTSKSVKNVTVQKALLKYIDLTTQQEMKSIESQMEAEYQQQYVKAQEAYIEKEISAIKVSQNEELSSQYRKKQRVDSMEVRDAVIENIGSRTNKTNKEQYGPVLPRWMGGTSRGVEIRRIHKEDKSSIRIFDDPFLGGLDASVIKIRRKEFQQINEISRLYSSARDLLVNGFSQSGEAEFNKLKSEAISVEDKMLSLEQKLQSANSLLPEEKIQLVSSVYKELSKYERDLNKRSRSSSSNNKYIYTLSKQNIKSLKASLQLKILNFKNSDTKQDTKVKQYLQRIVNRYSETDVLLNNRNMLREGKAIFSGFKVSEIDIKEYHLTDKIKGDATTSIKNSSNAVSIVNQIKSLRQYYPETDSEGLKIARYSLAVDYLDTLEKQYRRQHRQLESISMNRADTSNSEVFDKKQKAAYYKSIEQHKKILSVIDAAKQQLSEKSSVTEYSKVFDEVNTFISAHDSHNTATIEFFRSPPPGNTDPRLNTYRTLEGVGAFNRIIDVVNEELQEGKELKGVRKLSLDESRNATATYVGAVGIITYGGGDFDGDPYTAIYNKVATLGHSIVDKRAVVKSLEARLTAINTQYESTEEKERKEKLRSISKDINSTLKVAKKEYENTLTKYKQLAAEGIKNIDQRARVQAAAFMGIDERYLISYKGEDVYDNDGNVTGKVYGFAKESYNADSVFSIMQTGYGLFDGIESSAGKLLQLRDITFDLLGTKTSSSWSLKFTKRLSEVSDERKLKLMRKRVSQLSKKHNKSDVLTNFLEGLSTDSEIEKTQLLNLANVLSGLKEESDSYMERRNIKEEAIHDESREEQRREIINQFIGVRLFGSMKANKSLQKMLGLSSSEVVQQSTYELLTKTLGKAGGDLLGKIYNTIIGTTFKDAPIISATRALENKDSILYKATIDFLDRKEKGNITIAAKAELESQNISIDDQDYEERLQSARNKIAEIHYADYFQLGKDAMKKSESVQGLMKNIHQILRDSIKLKSEGAKQVQRLTEESNTYDKLSKELDALDPSSFDSEEDYKKKKAELTRRREDIIVKLSSELGPGAGLKSLTGLDYLINMAPQQGLSKREMLQFFEGGVSESRFETVSKRLVRNNIITQTELDTARRISDYETNDTLKLIAQSETAFNITTLINSYRFDNRIAQSSSGIEGKSTVTQFAESHTTRLALENLSRVHGSEKAVQMYEADRDRYNIETRKQIEAKYLTLGEDNSVKEKYDERFKDALSIHLEVSDSSELDSKVRAAAREANLSVSDYLLMFDATYTHTTEGADTLFGEFGEKLTQLSPLEHIRKLVAGSFASGETEMGTDKFPLINNLDTEILTIMSQSLSQGKLTQQGINTFALMYRGVVSGLMDAAEVTFESEEQRTNAITKTVYKAVIGIRDEDATRLTSEEAKDWANIQNAMLEDEEYLKAFAKELESTFTGQQAQLLKSLSTDILLGVSEDDNQLDKLIDQFIPNSVEAESRQSQRENIKRSVRRQKAIQERIVFEEQLNLRRQHIKDAGFIRRGSLLDKLDSNVSKMLSTNKFSNTLDVFVPIALSVLATGISEGTLDSNTIQETAGIFITSYMYAAPSMKDDKDPNRLKRRTNVSRTINSVFKFNNALERNDDNYLMASMDVLVHEGVSMTINNLVTPHLTNYINKQMGIQQGLITDTLSMNKYTAGQQFSSSVASSMISAVSSVAISSILMKNVVKPLVKSAAQMMQEYEPAVSLQQKINDDIALQMAEEQSYQTNIELKTSDREAELLSVDVIAEVAYSESNRQAIMDLQASEDLPMDSLGNVSFTAG